MFGITSPKYSWEIQAYNRKVKGDEKRKKQEEESFSGWKSQSTDDPETSTQSGPRIGAVHQMQPLDPISVESIATVPSPYEAPVLHM
jgi:hypothetical protein